MKTVRSLSFGRTQSTKYRRCANGLKFEFLFLIFFYFVEPSQSHSSFVWIGEVYWDMEYQLQQLGFTFTYDKRLYDRLRSGNAREVSAHLTADLDYQQRSARFLENHDEQRAAQVFPDPNQHQAAALISFTCPGLHFFHMGQLQGRNLKLSMHLRSLLEESELNPAISDLYTRLLPVVKRSEFRSGSWQRLHTTPSQDQNPSHENLIASIATHPRRPLSFTLVIVNYSPHEANGHVFFPPQLAQLFEQAGVGTQVLLRDLLRPDHFERNLTTCEREGLWVKLDAWHSHVLEGVSASCLDLGLFGEVGV
eukprot:c18736_g1_i1.p1 GENE.c18736_g1_i1~~c18736_g1_i1.p1  ORF type:complete len:308 (-),score=54.97 c18736_g1_i1:31-954(-)